LIEEIKECIKKIGLTLYDDSNELGIFGRPKDACFKLNECLELALIGKLETCFLF
jgi:hypothetical protein